jgi:uncharacterized protein (TIGR00255 family)
MPPIASMTGYGRAEKTTELGTFSAEVKTVNHRFLETRVHVPRELSRFEIPLQRVIDERLSRGKVDASIRWKPSPGYASKAVFNEDLLERYATEIARIAENLDREDTVSLEFLLGLPGVSDGDTLELDDDVILEQSTNCLNEALDVLIDERRREGKSLADALLALLNNLDAQRMDIAGQTQSVVDACRERLMKKASEWAQSASIQVDPGRLEAEVLMFADRADVTEELTRLETHITAFREALTNESLPSQGKPLDFLTQELLREANTTASKARNSAIVALVLSMKNTIEKIREQVMNIE